MITRRLYALALPLCLAAILGACDKVPLLAPTGSSIILTTATNVLPTNGMAEITAQLIEAGGTPPHSGTLVTFTTTLGSVSPTEAETNSAGQVKVQFLAGAANGTAAIVASSGGATTGTNGALKISVGTAAIGSVKLNASPATVSALGGTTTITANVFDINGNALSSAIVAFSTTAGTISAAVATTNANGLAAITLTTSQTAIVTASVGAQAPAAPPTGTTTTPTTPTSTGQASASVTVNVSTGPTLVITPPSILPSAGLPASYTFAVTAATQNGSAIRDVTVDWGAGTPRTQDLGAVTGSAVVSHVYPAPGTYTIVAQVTDAAGNVTTISTSVTVIQAPLPTISINYSPIPAKVNTQTTFTIQVTPPAGLGIVSTSINFGDGGSADLGGASGTVTQPHVYVAQNTYTVTVTVVDTTGRTTIGSNSVSVGP